MYNHHNTIRNKILIIGCLLLIISLIYSVNAQVKKTTIALNKSTIKNNQKLKDSVSKSSTPEKSEDNKKIESVLKKSKIKAKPVNDKKKTDGKSKVKKAKKNSKEKTVINKKSNKSSKEKVTSYVNDNLNKQLSNITDVHVENIGRDVNVEIKLDRLSKTDKFVIDEEKIPYTVEEINNLKNEVKRIIKELDNQSANTNIRFNIVSEQGSLFTIENGQIILENIE